MNPAHDPGSSRLPVAVLGAGITGLSAAWHLQRAGIPATVFESLLTASAERSKSIRRDGWVARRAAPNSVLEGPPLVAEDDRGPGPRIPPPLCGRGGEKPLRRAGRAARADAVLAGVISAQPAVFPRRQAPPGRGNPPAPGKAERGGDRGRIHCAAPGARFSRLRDRSVCRRRLCRRPRPAFGAPRLSQAFGAGGGACLGSLLRGAIRRRNTRGAPGRPAVLVPRGVWTNCPRALARDLGRGAVRLRARILSVRRSGGRLAGGPRRRIRDAGGAVLPP